MRLIDPMELKLSLAISSILADGKTLEQIIDEQPTIEERKTGRWELAEDGWYCSVCELYPPFDCDPEEKGIPYCPNCGARMMEVEND